VTVLTALLTVMGATILVFAIGRLLLLPSALAAEVADARRRSRTPVPALTLSVVIPAFDEAKVIEPCVRSILATCPPATEIIVVDDGSADDTLQRIRALEEQHPAVRALWQPNAGKAAALNHGISRATGEIVMLVDADGVFVADTIPEILRPFADSRVGAVCGDDRPVNLDRVQTRFLAITGHVGTGLMRRALTALGCLPIVSGNSGAFRRAVLDEVGGLRSDCIGEDLELTWRVRRAGHRVVFAPRALVYSESASTLRGLWRQRVRWARGLLQCLWLYRTVIGRPSQGLFAMSLGVLAFGALVLPLLQLLAVPLIMAASTMGEWSGTPDLWSALLWLGLPLSAALVVVATTLNRALGDLRWALTLLLWPAYSLLMSCVTVAAMWAEVRRRPRRWNKLERTGVRSVAAVAGAGSG
jgi:biofilm PGA synthesis N-glycosyltransferase PgaC